MVFKSVTIKDSVGQLELFFDGQNNYLIWQFPLFHVTEIKKVQTLVSETFRGEHKCSDQSFTVFLDYKAVNPLGTLLLDHIPRNRLVLMWCETDTEIPAFEFSIAPSPTAG